MVQADIQSAKRPKCERAASMLKFGFSAGYMREENKKEWIQVKGIYIRLVLLLTLEKEIFEMFPELMLLTTPP
jgi:hypothetical protein